MISKGCLVRTVVAKHWKPTVFLAISDPYENDLGEPVIQVYSPSKWGNASIYYVASLEVISGV
jgi:hypothetical protein